MIADLCLIFICLTVAATAVACALKVRECARATERNAIAAAESARRAETARARAVAARYRAEAAVRPRRGFPLSPTIPFELAELNLADYVDRQEN